MPDPSSLFFEDEPEDEKVSTDETGTPTEQVNTESPLADVRQLVGKYVKIRDALSKKRKEFKELEARAKRKMEEIEVEILELSRGTGVDSFKTKFGTAFKTTKTYARVAGPEGWEKLCQLMVQRNDFGLVEKRVAKLHFMEVMKEEMEKDGGLAPIEMGVEYVEEEAIQVRRN